MQNVKIILLGSQTSIAQTILGQLEAHHYPFDQIILMDIHHKTPNITYYMGEEKPIFPIDLFSEKPPFIALICDRNIPLIYPKKHIPKRAFVIDCTGTMNALPCYIPQLISLKENTHLICAPTSLSVILSHLFIPLKSKATNFQVTALIGTSFLGQNAHQKLLTQTQTLYTKFTIPSELNTPDLAFNLIPEFIPKTELITPNQFKCMTNIPLLFSHCFVPIFRGFCLYISCQTKQKPDFKKIFEHNPLITLLEKPTPDFLMSTHATLSENTVYIHHICTHQHQTSFWLTGDDLQSGMALNVIHIIQSLEKSI